mgnify:CR=1 FL=1|jgi:Arc/MetJ-type ribon-helix-helix transcriptional regulator
MRKIKKTPSTRAVLDKNNVADDCIYHEKQSNKYKITVRLSVLLIDTLKNIIISNKVGGNFEYTNTSDLIRNALDAYKNGMTLIAQRAKDEKKETSLRVTQELKEFYSSLPKNAKSEIIERAVSTYINHRL